VNQLDRRGVLFAAMIWRTVARTNLESTVARIRSCPASPRYHKLHAQISRLAPVQTLGLAVIAEGVETEAQRGFPSDNGCRAFQGYLSGHPGAAESLLESRPVA